MAIILSPNIVVADPNDPSFTADQPVIGYNNVVLNAVLSATSASAVGSPLSNLQTPSTAERWISGALTGNTIDLAFDSPSQVDYIAICRHNLSSSNYSIEVQAHSEFDGSSVPIRSTVVPSFMAGTDGPLLRRFAPGYYAGIRIVLTPQARGPGRQPAQMAVLYIGRSLLLQRRIYVGHTPVPFGRRTRIVNNRSENGQFLGRTERSVSHATTIVVENMTPTWYREYMDPFVNDARINPFFFAWRPSGYPDEVGYMWTSGDPSVSNQRNNGMMQVSMPVGAIA